MKNRKKSILQLMVIIVIIALCAFTTLVGFTESHKGSARNIKLGLDLAGGVSITYKADKANPTKTEMKDTINKMQKRAEVYSTESSVVQEGTNRVVIDIPGVDNADAVLKALGKAGSLDFVSQDDMSFTKSGKPQYTKVVCTGSDIKKAEAATQQDDVKNTENVVQIKFTPSGTKKFADATEKLAPEKKIIYIVYDGKVVSNPSVKTAITNGECVIEGGFKTYDEADALASTIRIGALPLKLKEIQSQVVGAQLGQDAIQTSLMAGAIGFALVVLFMIIFYRLPGLASSIALVFYLVIFLVGLNVLDITLTLPGVAGIILNIGMAVDANVIIFTRIKEELAKGKSVQASIKTGFNKALSAIVDGNVTTLIAAAVLYAKGSGTVKGFATTLTIGTLLSMFTALYITRLILNAMYVLGVDDPKYFGVEKPRKIIHFVENRIKFFCISGVLIAGCIVMLIVNSQSSLGHILNYGLDFLGGTTYDITFNSDQKIDSSLKKDIESIFEKNSGSADVVVSKVAGANKLSVKTVEMKESQRASLTKELSTTYNVKEKDIQWQSISASVSDEMKSDAVVAVIIATICMLLYIWFRFKDITFAGSAVLALVHDVLVVLLVYAAARITVGNTFIACMLTIVGYSINATIVIFDRIRENLKGKKTKEQITEVVNESITQTLTRSINTSLTTFFMVLMLVIFGVDSVREFAIPLMAGIVCGAYSSVCITGTLWFTMHHFKMAPAAKGAVAVAASKQSKVEDAFETNTDEVWDDVKTDTTSQFENKPAAQQTNKPAGKKQSRKARKKSKGTR